MAWKANGGFGNRGRGLGRILQEESWEAPVTLVTSCHTKLVTLFYRPGRYKYLLSHLSRIFYIYMLITTLFFLCWLL